MAQKAGALNRFLTWSAKEAARPVSFMWALIVLGSWVLGGFFFGFTNTWLLILNTIATITASLMVFIIQHTQYRESKALNIKVDELLRVVKEAEVELIAIEEMEEEELEKLREKLKRQKPKKKKLINEDE